MLGYFTRLRSSTGISPSAGKPRAICVRVGDPQAIRGVLLHGSAVKDSTMRRIILTAVAVILLIVAGLAAVVYTGSYDVAADRLSWGPVAWVARSDEHTSQIQS